MDRKSTPRKRGQGKLKATVELAAWLQREKPAEIGEPESEVLHRLLAPISESYLRRLLRDSGVPLAPLVEGVRQESFETLEASLMRLLVEYERADSQRRLAIRRLVMATKDHARWAVAQALLPAVSRLISTPVSRGMSADAMPAGRPLHMEQPFQAATTAFVPAWRENVQTRSVGMSADAAGTSACATSWQARTGPARPPDPSETRKASAEPCSVVRAGSSKDEKRAEKEEMILWMLTWLENPPLFPEWVRLRRRVVIGNEET